MSTVSVPANQCDFLDCLHIWLRRKKIPARCARCKRPGWDKAGVAQGTEQRDSNSTVAGSIPAPSTKKPVVKAAIEKGLQKGHDPKTCRVYRCGMCAALKGAA